MATYNTLRELFSAISASIKKYKGTTTPIAAMDFPTEIENLTANTTATASDILLNKTAWSNGAKITGTIPSAAATTITPGTSNKTAISAGTYAAGNIVVAGDSDLVANNIRAGKEIFGVTGSSWAGTLTFTGSYANNATYYTAAGCSLAVDKDTGMAFITIQGGTSTAYENIYFTEHSLPNGVTALTTQTYGGPTNGDTQRYFTQVLTGITGKINVAVNISSRDSSYDYVQAKLTVTYA